ncbi:MAG: amidohydrolase family protein [Gemmatimonadota bacterium]
MKGRGLPGLVLAFTLAGPVTAPTALQGQAVRALVGGTVVDGTGAPPLADGVVVVEGDRIRCVGRRADCPIPDDAERIDVTGRWLTPGLVDAHVHFSQTGWLDGRPDGLSVPEIYPYAETASDARDNPDRWHRSYLCSGITAVYDPGGHPWTTGLPQAAEGRADRVHVRAAGPLVTFASVPALNLDDELYTFLPMSTDQEAMASVDRLVAMGATSVKVWYLRVPADRREALDARLMRIGARAREAGLDLIVHATDLRGAKVALRAGAAMLVHSVEDRLVDDEFLELARAVGVVYAPTLRVGAHWTRARISVALNAPAAIDDPNGCVDERTVERIRETERLQPHMPDRFRDDLEWALASMRSVGRTEAIMAENLRRVRSAGVTIATATDAGNPLTLHGPSIYEEMEAMQAAGIPAAEVVVLSTRNGARAMGREADFGTLEPGKLADLLVLARDPTEDVAAFRNLTRVMRAGVLHDQEALRYR